MLVKRFRNFIEQQAEEKSFLLEDEKVQPLNNLSESQIYAFKKIEPAVTKAKYQVSILHGVTGSGKTEIYKHLILRCFEMQKSTILLLPEVSLAMRFEAIMKATFGQQNVLGFHSASTNQHKKLLWKSLINHSPCLIIGVHLPVLLPIANLGMIVVDEEHEVGYQEKKHPRLNSKELAILRAKQTEIPIILGSATPSISSLHALNRPEWQLVSLTERFAGALPNIKLVKINPTEKKQHFLITNELQQTMTERLHKKEQIIIFLNRRGYSFFVQCLNCLFIFNCNHCSVSLTLHADNILRCHYCDFKQSLPLSCPECRCRRFIKKGVGTQQIVSILEKIFPSARIARADLDSTAKKREWGKTAQAFHEQKIDILVGTQTITKGYHFPNVTLVGILWADINLNLPLFNAAETTLQQILQVAGRAGRQKLHSDVIVQTMSPHPIFNFLTETNYLQFYESEIKKRALAQYPPVSRLAEIEIKSRQEKLAESETEEIYYHLKNKQQYASSTITVLGPVKPTISKLKNWHIRKIYLKSNNMISLIEFYKTISLASFKSQISFIPTPLS